MLILSEIQRDSVDCDEYEVHSSHVKEVLTYSYCLCMSEVIRVVSFLKRYKNIIIIDNSPYRLNELFYNRHDAFHIDIIGSSFKKHNENFYVATAFNLEYVEINKRRVTYLCISMHKLENFVFYDKVKTPVQNYRRKLVISDILNNIK